LRGHLLNEELRTAPLSAGAPLAHVDRPAVLADLAPGDARAAWDGAG